MIEINNSTKQKINLSLIQRIVENFLKFYKKEKYDLSIAFVSGTEMRKLNKQYRHSDKTTDVLSFEGEGNFFGEIIMNYAQIKKQAAEFGNSAESELVFILIHGLLHLLGYNDTTDEGREEMIRLGEEFIGRRQ